MAIIKTWRVITMSGTVTTVEAHQLTIEPSGALSFWAVTPDNMQAVLLFAFGASKWERVEIADVPKRIPAPSTQSEGDTAMGGHGGSG